MANSIPTETTKNPKRLRRYTNADFWEEDARVSCFTALRRVGPRMRSRLSSTCSSLFSMPSRRSQSTFGAVFEAKQRQFSRKIPADAAEAIVVTYRYIPPRDSLDLYERRSSSDSDDQFLADLENVSL